ncbi:LAMI_0H14554g1_1 [Lachancea mirantina]|uniref:LAMI_0H14554g1_1 n=1 Tax=Lachancea mirantina TaxID=1230905 RepID=A0A1G4KIM1_9SACH|nr:LAMI_0H14554g1_1 [Lachancea mirantina]
MKRSASPVAETAKKLKISESFEEYYRPDPTYYPHPISWKKANEFNNGKRRKPCDLLDDYIKSQKVSNSAEISTVLHWFRMDHRLQDNTAFSAAVEKFRQLRKKHSDTRFVAVYTVNEHDWKAHLDSAWKLVFLREAVNSLRSSLQEIDVPLVIKNFHPKNPVLSNSHEFATWFKALCGEICGDNGVLVTANAQYETDELYRDLKIAGMTDEKFHFQVFHDQCVVQPGVLTTGKGSQYTVFTPWYKRWVKYLEEEQRGSKDIVKVNKIDVKEKVNDSVEALKALDSDEFKLAEEFTSYLPVKNIQIPTASEEAAHDLLESFIEKGKLKEYNEKKDILGLDSTSNLSCYITNGLMSTRAIVNRCFHENGALMHGDIRQNNSIENFIKEVAWRDFYRHVNCNWPYLSMEVAFKFETMEIKWENDQETFRKWCLGMTGFPIVDAIMRRLLHTGYINNRSRMIVASFLAKNLLIDWRWGERWFRKHLIDGDLASNSGGWGFCSSTGVDAQPFFRIFNMALQSQKYDPEGVFIKKWLPELKDVKEVKTLHESSLNRSKCGYPERIVDLKDSRERALAAFREVV